MAKMMTAAVVMALLISAEATAAVQLTIRDGRVWLKADRATPAQILAEWARVGQIQMVNSERVPGGPLSLALDAMPELEALGIVLRSAGGFVTLDRPRLSAADSGSRFERVVIVPLPSSAPPVTPRAADVQRSPQTAAVPIPIVTPSGAQRVIGADGQPVPDDQEGAQPPGPPGRSIPPGFSPPPERPSGQPPAAGPTGATPQMMPGAPRPGVIVPPPTPKKPGG
jgi:hypothetical protein